MSCVRVVCVCMLCELSACVLGGICELSVLCLGAPSIPPCLRFSEIKEGGIPQTGPLSPQAQKGGRRPRPRGQSARVGKAEIREEGGHTVKSLSPKNGDMAEPTARLV